MPVPGRHEAIMISLADEDRFLVFSVLRTSGILRGPACYVRGVSVPVGLAETAASCMLLA